MYFLSKICDLPPRLGTVETQTLLAQADQYAIRRPFGDQVGAIAELEGPRGN
jgi:hypothetical protein